MASNARRPDTNPDAGRNTPASVAQQGAATMTARSQQSAQQGAGTALPQVRMSGSAATSQMMGSGAAAWPDVFRPLEEPSTQRRTHAGAQAPVSSRTFDTRPRWPARYSVTE